VIASTVVERGRSGLLTLLIAVSLLLSMLPAAAAQIDYGISDWDFLDPNELPWERSHPKADAIWQKALRSITWE
jgi:hypothetical protein